VSVGKGTQHVDCRGPVGGVGMELMRLGVLGIGWMDGKDGCPRMNLERNLVTNELHSPATGVGLRDEAIETVEI
jgi:hypothetical protein